MSRYTVWTNGTINWVSPSGQRETKADLHIPHADNVHDREGLADLLEDIARRLRAGTLERDETYTVGGTVPPMRNGLER